MFPFRMGRSRERLKFTGKWTHSTTDVLHKVAPGQLLEAAPGCTSSEDLVHLVGILGIYINLTVPCIHLSIHPDVVY